MMTIGISGQAIGSSWTDERIKILIDDWMSGMSASQCAAELGITRNAAMGKIKRLGLPEREKGRKPSRIRSRTLLLQPQPRKRRAPRIERKPLPPSISIYNSQGRIVPLYEASTTAEDDLLIPVDQRRSLLELRDGMCRWPVGEPSAPGFFFCAAKTIPEKSYCLEHWCRGHAPTPARRSVYIPARNAVL